MISRELSTRPKSVTEEPKETPMTRRAFFNALAASALLAGIPMPIGWPKEPRVYKWTQFDIVIEWKIFKPEDLES